MCSGPTDSLPTPWTGSPRLRGAGCTVQEPLRKSVVIAERHFALGATFDSKPDAVEKGNRLPEGLLRMSVGSSNVRWFSSTLPP